MTQHEFQQSTNVQTGKLVCRLTEVTVTRAATYRMRANYAPEQPDAVPTRLSARLSVCQSCTDNMSVLSHVIFTTF